MTCAPPPARARSAFSEELTVAITVAPAQVAAGGHRIMADRTGTASDK